MNNTPEKIWAYAGTFKMWRDHKTDAPHTQIEYTRTDIADARIEELTEVVTRLRCCVSPFPSEDTERYREEYEACEMADVALKDTTNE